MWKKWVRGWKFCMLAITAACFSWFVFQSSRTAYLISEVSLLFAVLFSGYRFGPGTGATAGSVCGLAMGLWTGELAQMGIFSVLGVFGGAFRRLGRAASAAAYLIAAFGVGLMYSPSLLFELMTAAIFGALIFLLLPAKLTDPGKEKRKFPAVEYQTLERAAGEQIRQAGGACQCLSGYFADENLSDLVR